MSFQELLTWTQLGRVEESLAPDVLKLVEAAFEEVPEDDPRFAALVEIAWCPSSGYCSWRKILPRQPPARIFSDVER